jgi:hypothetical protein
MFEAARALEPQPLVISLYTIKGTPIYGFMECEASDIDERKFQAITKSHGSNWIIRKQATGRYNCAGHVFANRRVTILKPEDWVKILVDDGYEDFEDESYANPGDLAAYVDRMSGEIVHLAQIVRLDRLFTGATKSRLMALSKWNSTSGEVLHDIYQSPYSMDLPKVVFWTDRRPPLKENASDFWCSERIIVR